jgi:hypothetical protein
MKKHTINKLVTVTRNSGWQDASNFTNVRVYIPFIENDRLLVRRGLTGNLLSSSCSVEKQCNLSCWAQTRDSTEHHRVYEPRDLDRQYYQSGKPLVWDYSRQIYLWSHKDCQCFLFFYSERARLYGIFLYDATSKYKSTQKAEAWRASSAS